MRKFLVPLLVLAAAVVICLLALAIKTPAPVKADGNIPWPDDQRNGRENLPCPYGALIVASPGDARIESIQVFSNYGNPQMQRVGGPESAWHANLNGPVGADLEMFATFTGSADSVETFLKVSHCLDGPEQSPTSPPPPSPTPTNTPTEGPSPTPTNTPTPCTENCDPTPVPTLTNTPNPCANDACNPGGEQNTAGKGGNVGLTLLVIAVIIVAGVFFYRRFR